MIGYVVLDQDDTAVAFTESPIGCYRRIAAASDVPVKWETVRHIMTHRGSFTTMVGGHLLTYRVVPRDEVEPISTWYQRLVDGSRWMIGRGTRVRVPGIPGAEWDGYRYVSDGVYARVDIEFVDDNYNMLVHAEAGRFRGDDFEVLGMAVKALPYQAEDIPEDIVADLVELAYADISS